MGGYVFGKLFKWKKLTKISPKKTLSGALGSLIFSLASVFLLGLVIETVSSLDSLKQLAHFMFSVQIQTFFLS